MTEKTEELIKCSRCRTSKLKSDYDINSKGKLYKTCNNCRKSKTEKINNLTEERIVSDLNIRTFISCDTSPSIDIVLKNIPIEIDNNNITIARFQFVTDFLQMNSKCKMEWLGLIDMDKSDIGNRDMPVFKALTGDEYIVEYHLFKTLEFGDDGPPIISRWRLLKPGINTLPV